MSLCEISGGDGDARAAEVESGRCKAAGRYGSRSLSIPLMDRNMGRNAIIRDDLMPGRHTIRCELLAQTHDPDGGTEFRMISLMRCVDHTPSLLNLGHACHTDDQACNSATTSFTTTRCSGKPVCGPPCSTITQTHTHSPLYTPQHNRIA